jgi:dTDP-glucose pyrophosphorylase
MTPGTRNNKFGSLIIDFEASILSALKMMDKINRKLLIVVKDDHFYSVLSIGDLQRAILKKFPLDEPVKNVLRTNIVFCTTEDSLEDIKTKMFSSRIELMPVIDNERNIVNVLSWEDVFGSVIQRKKISLNLPVVIMAGGTGTRLKPLTNVLPKPLIPINEKTIIENIMDNFLEIGCNKFYISVNYKVEIIKYFFENLDNDSYDISYFQETLPLGTAGSMYLLKNSIKSTFFVSNCDIIIDQDLSEVYQYHVTNKNDVTIISALKNHKIPYGTIETNQEGFLHLLNENPELVFQINTGVYILEPSVLMMIPDNAFVHITDLIKTVSESGGKIGVFPIAQNSYSDIGNWQEYLNLINPL